MFLMANSLFKRKSKATIEFSGQFLLSGQEIKLIRTIFFRFVAGFQTDLTQCGWGDGRGKARHYTVKILNNFWLSGRFSLTKVM